METISYGDRNVEGNCVFPPEAFYHNGQGGGVLDVTRAPFHARGDGKSDDTAALRAAMTFVRDNCSVVRRGDQTMCSPQNNRNWIIYLPDGIYNVSDTISQNWPAAAMNVLRDWYHIDYFPVTSATHERELYEQGTTACPVLHGNELLTADDNNNGDFSRGQYLSSHVYNEVNWNIRIFGQSRAGTILRLQDGASGFGKNAGASGKPVLSFYLLQRGSNVNLGNFCENLSIDTGRDNPGAVALRWNSSNWGGIRNVRLLGSGGGGLTGLQMECNNATGYCRDLSIEGFDVGIELTAGRESMLALEYATLRRIGKVGLCLGGNRNGGGGDSFSGRRLLFDGVPLALHCRRAGQCIVMESKICASHQSWQLEEDSFLLLRDSEVNGARIGRWCSREATAQTPNRSELPVKDVPVLPWTYSLDDSVNVESYGAAGDGVTDDTAAIQRAMDSGRPVIYFTRSNYVINGSVNIPASVRQIIGCFSGIQRSTAVKHPFDGPALFCVAKTAEEPLYIRQIVSVGGVLIDHEAERTLVLEDLMVFFNHCRTDASEPDMLFPSAVPQDVALWRLYRNTRPQGARKELFITGCVNFAGEERPGEAVENVRAWCRYLDTEHVSGALYSFKRSEVWIMGCKSENSPTLLRVTDGTKAELWGGTFLNFTPQPGPILEVADSELATVFFLWHWRIVPGVIRQHSDPGQCLTANDFSPLKQADAAVIFLD